MRAYSSSEHTLVKNNFRKQQWIHNHNEEMILAKSIMDACPQLTRSQALIEAARIMAGRN